MNITELTELWYKLVSLDHHKDRDCHWYINKIWSYGNPPIYRVEHYGYVYEDIGSEDFKEYKDAERYLRNEIENAIQIEIKWANKVLKERTSAGWGEYNIERANGILKLIKEYGENR